MRFGALLPWLLFGLASTHVIERRGDGDDAEDDHHDDRGHWKPKTTHPHFFNLKVNDRCDPWADEPETQKWQCPFDSFAIRLEKGILVATPYNKWWDPKLATFFVDDDTQMYTVSREPLQLYVDAVTGAVKYTKVGWLPPSAISTGWYHTGNNPLQLVDPTPSYLTWPSTQGITQGGEFTFCPLGETGQWQVFVNNFNFNQQGVEKQACTYYPLAALNANPWKKQKHWTKDHHDDDSDDFEDQF